MYGAVSPTEFVTLAEATDLIHPLTYWSIRTALADLKRWNEQGAQLRVAINISARVLQDVDFPARLKRLLHEAAVRPAQVELEITESAMLIDPQRAKDIVKELHGLGVLIAIDDYGTGFSSLGYLRDLRVHSLKLDKSFVVDLETREQNRVIVESTVQMAHALGLQVVAEGVETKWVEEYLRSIGYDLGQGYLRAPDAGRRLLRSLVREPRVAAPRGLTPLSGLSRALSIVDLGASPPAAAQPLRPNCSAYAFLRVLDVLTTPAPHRPERKVGAADLESARPERPRSSCVRRSAVHVPPSNTRSAFSGDTPSSRCRRDAATCATAGSVTIRS